MVAALKRGEQSCTLLPLIKRPAPKHDQRSKRDRNLALPAHAGGMAPKSTDFEVGCEVYVPRQHSNGRTFNTWCVVLKVKRDHLVVDVPNEEPQPVSMMQLLRVAEVMNEGPAGPLLAEMRRLRAQVAQLESEVAKLRRAGEPASTAIVPYSPTPTAPPSLSRPRRTAAARSTALVVYGAEVNEPAKRAKLENAEDAEEAEEAEETEDAEEGEKAEEEEAEEEEDEEEDEEEMDEADDVAEATHGWQRLELRCAITWQRLTDPARLLGCSQYAPTTLCFSNPTPPCRRFLSHSP